MLCTAPSLHCAREDHHFLLRLTAWQHRNMLWAGSMLSDQHHMLAGAACYQKRSQ